MRPATPVVPHWTWKTPRTPFPATWDRDTPPLSSSIRGVSRSLSNWHRDPPVEPFSDEGYLDPLDLLGGGGRISSLSVGSDGTGQGSGSKVGLKGVRPRLQPESIGERIQEEGEWIDLISQPPSLHHSPRTIRTGGYETCRFVMEVGSTCMEEDVHDTWSGARGKEGSPEPPSIVRTRRHVTIDRTKTKDSNGCLCRSCPSC